MEDGGWGWDQFYCREWRMEVGWDQFYCRRKKSLDGRGINLHTEIINHCAQKNFTLGEGHVRGMGKGWWVWSLHLFWNTVNNSEKTKTRIMNGNIKRYNFPQTYLASLPVHDRSISHIHLQFPAAV